MRIKPYYCKRCEKFLRWWHVTDYGLGRNYYCKWCGNTVIEVKDILEGFIVGAINMKGKHDGEFSENI